MANHPSFQVYDFTTKRYLTKIDDRINWTCFKRDAHTFQTRQQAQDFIDYWRPFTSNEFHILTVSKKPDSPSQFAASLRSV